LAPRHARILIAEDNEDVRYILQRMLEDAGHEVLSASDGVEALEVMGSPDQLDLVITDIRMPRMGGYPLAERLRAARPDLPIIYVTGYAVGWQNAAEVGPNTAFLQKPFAEQDLMEAIARLLSRGE
jgi:CheY-like chemotaxis protein